MEASTLRPAATLPKPRITVGAPLLRLRSDEQLVALFRQGHEEAFGAIHDRYHRRLFAYARQMLPARQDAEDVLQDVFVRAYAGLRASERDLALRPWLFRVAHNRCIDQLRKPNMPPPEVLLLVRSPVHDPLAEVDLRESMRRLIEDIRQLPDQQRSALLMRELAGMSYAELACSLGISVGAVKSVLVRARIALAQACDARETSCATIREHLVEAHDRGIRPNANSRKHMRECSCCKDFRRELRGVSRQLAAISPAVGPLAFVAKTLGFSGGGGAGGGAALLGGGGTTASTGGLALGTGHVATLIVAAVATAGGAVAIQRTILPATPHPPKVQSIAHTQTPAPVAQSHPASITPATSATTSRVTKPWGTVTRRATPALAPAKRPDKALRKLRAAATEQMMVAAASAAGVGTTMTANGSQAAACTTTPATTSTGSAGTTSAPASSTTSSSATGSTTSGPTTSGSTGSGTSGSGTSGSGSSGSGSSGSSTANSTSSSSTTGQPSTASSACGSGAPSSAAGSGGSTGTSGSSGAGGTGSGGVGTSSNSSATPAAGSSSNTGSSGSGSTTTGT